MNMIRNLALVLILIFFLPNALANQHDYYDGNSLVSASEYWLEKTVPMNISFELRAFPTASATVYYVLEADIPGVSNCEINSQSVIGKGVYSEINAPNAGPVSLSFIVKRIGDNAVVATHAILLHAFNSAAEFPRIEFANPLVYQSLGTTQVAVSAELHNATNNGGPTAAYFDTIGVSSSMTFANFASSTNTPINGQDLTFDVTPIQFGAHKLAFPITVAGSHNITIYKELYFIQIVKKAVPYPNSIPDGAASSVFLKLVDFALSATPTLSIVSGTATTLSVDSYTTSTLRVDVVATSLPLEVEITRTGGDTVNFTLEEESAAEAALRDMVKEKIDGEVEPEDGDCCLKLKNGTIGGSAINAIREKAIAAGASSPITGEFSGVRYVIHVGANGSAGAAGTSYSGSTAGNGGDGVQGDAGSAGDNGGAGAAGTPESPNGGNGVNGEAGDEGNLGDEGDDGYQGSGYVATVNETPAGGNGSTTATLVIKKENHDCEILTIIVAGNGGNGGDGGGGQNGGNGGRGGKGGTGGTGGSGGNGGAGFAPAGAGGTGGTGGAAGIGGNGGQGGDGGDGGDGGKGGDGGDGQEVVIKALKGLFLVIGGNGGNGGDGGSRGRMGAPGLEGYAGDGGIGGAGGQGGTGTPAGLAGAAGSGPGASGGVGVVGGGGNDGLHGAAGKLGKASKISGSGTTCFHLHKFPGTDGANGSPGTD